jgi:hypothetical protein
LKPNETEKKLEINISMNPFFHLLFILALLSSCSNKKPSTCVESDIYALIREKKMTDLTIMNREELRFKHSSTKQFPTNENGYCACLWKQDLPALEDSLQTHGLSNYQTKMERDNFADALGYVLPGLLLISLLLIPLGAILLFREKRITDIQRLTYLLLILFVPLVGFLIYLKQWKARRE